MKYMRGCLLYAIIHDMVGMHHKPHAIYQTSYALKELSAY